MSADLETELRAALRERAERVTPERLRHAERPAPRGRRRTPLPAALAAAALVAVLAVGVAVVRGGSTHRSDPATSPSLVGSQWTLVDVRDVRGDTAIPATAGARISFTRKELLAYDTCNGMTTTYRAVSGELTLSGGVGSTLVLCPRRYSSPARTAAMDALGALMQGDPSQGTPRRHTVTVSRTGNTLVLTTRTYVLRFRYAGAIAPARSVSPSGSPSRT